MDWREEKWLGQVTAVFEPGLSCLYHKYHLRKKRTRTGSHSKSELLSKTFTRKRGTHKPRGPYNNEVPTFLPL